MEQREAEILILSIVLFTVLGCFMVLLFLTFIKRKNTLLKKKNDAEQNFKREIITTQIEIREETLKNISWELHDNIGQLMTLAKIQAQNAQGDPKKMEAVSEIIGKGLNELRSLSKSINPETMRNLDFEEAVKIEIERFNRLNFINAKFSVSGEKIEIDSKVSIVLFRILQEFFSNTIKHSQATTLDVSIDYSENQINVDAKDNGIGIHKKEEGPGQGLKNMKSRALLINADLQIHMIPDKGTTLNMNFKPQKTN